jgi:DNA-binding transcriptional MerR regulator
MIPNKSNFKFQELTPITGVKPYVIRFWETEFDEISPVDSDSGQKIYARKDVEAILKIKKLLFVEKMTVLEAKIAIKGNHVEIEATAQGEVADVVKESGDVDFAKNMLISALQVIREIKSKNNW